MASSGEEYFVSRNQKIERRKRMLTIVSIVSFVGSSVIAIIPAIQNAGQQPKSPAVSAESSLQQQARGYELVLQREPENQTAMEQLVMVRLRLQDGKGAREILEKLVKLHPDRQDYKSVLEQVKKKQSEVERSLKK